MGRPKGFVDRACINIYLEKSQKELLTKLAVERKKSPSAIVRYLIEQSMATCFECGDSLTTMCHHCNKEN